MAIKKNRKLHAGLALCMICNMFSGIPVKAAENDAIISNVEPTLYVREIEGSTEEKPLYRNDVSIVVNSKEEFDAWAKIKVGTDESPYVVKISDKIRAGNNNVIVPVTDTKDVLDTLETTTLKIELYDNENCTGSAKAIYEDNEWERTRRWEVYFSQTMHTDIGFTDYQEDLRKDVAEYLDEAQEFVDKSNNRETDEQKYKYMIESGWDLGESYMKLRNAEQIEELTDLIKEKINMSITAGLFNYTTETFNTEELARATYYTNRYLVDSLGIEPSELQNMFDNPSFTKSYVDTAVQAGIKYGFHSMNQAHSPYHKKRQYDIFYMQGNDPENKMLIYNGYKYSVSFGFDSNVDAANKEVVKVLTQLQNRPKERGTDLSPYPYDKFCFAIVPYGDNAGPRDIDIQIANQLNKQWEDAGYAYPKIKVEFQDTFMKDVEKEYGPEGADIIPTETGTEENWWNDGWGTTAYESGINKEAGNLLGSAEKAASLASMMTGEEYPYEELNEAMNRNLTYDEHTWGSYGGAAGSDFYHNQFEWKRSNAFGTKTLAEKIMDDSLNALSRQVKTTEDKSIYVYNPLNWNRDDVVTIEDTSKFPSKFEIMDGDTSLPYSMKEDGTLTFVAKDVPAMGYKTFSIKEVDVVENTTKTTQIDGNVIENDYYKVIFAKDGTIASIIDKQNGNREIVDSEADVKFNQYQYYDDFGVKGGDYSTSIIDKDVWKRYQPDENSSRLILEDTPMGTTAKLDTSTFRASAITQTVTLYDDIPRIDISNEVIKEALPNLSTKEEAYYTFPFKAGDDYKIQYDLPAGNTGEGEQVYGTCTDWYTANKWVNVKDGNYNMALAIPNTTLLMFGERRLGEWSFDYKSEKPYIYSWVMNNFWDTNFQRDQPGYVNFKYSISTNVDENYEKTSKFGWEISNPLQATLIENKQENGTMSSEGSFINIDNSNVQLTTIKTSESNGEGMILRFHEVSGKDSTVNVDLPFENVSSVVATDIIENDKEKVSDGNTFTFKIPAYGITTFRVNFDNNIEAVTGVNAVTGNTPINGTQVSWNKVDGAKYYEVFRSSNPDDEMDKGCYLGSTTKNTWFDTQVVEGLSKPYYYKVRAVGNGVKSEMSEAAKQNNGTIVDAGAPNKPILGAQTRSKSQVDLYWTPVFDDIQIKNYEIKRDGEVIKTTTDNYVTTFRDKSVEKDKEYTYTVVAVDVNGNRIESDPVVASTEFEEGPTLSNLIISNGVLSQNFNPTQNIYEIMFGNKLTGINDITITPITDDEEMVITVNGEEVKSGEASKPLKVEENSEFTVKLTKGDQFRTYMLYPTVGLPMIHPINAEAGSTYRADKTPLNIINNSGMSGRNSLEDTHDNNGSANTMWHTAKNPGEDAWVTVDLGNVYKLDEMYLWNMNQGTNDGKNPENSERAMKNVKIEYSRTGEDGSWVELKPEEGIEFLEQTEEGYPFQLAPTDGNDKMPASNLNDGNKTPVRFNGEEARFVKISAHPELGKGNWSTGKKGSEYYGLSEVRFTAFIDRSIYKKDLQDLVEECKEINKDEYLDRNWEVFEKELENAMKVLADEKANQNAIDNAETALRAALENLVKKPTIENPIIKPLEATAGSTFNMERQNPNHVIDDSGMSGKDSLQDTHDNNNSALTMWHTTNNPGENAWIQVDLGKVYELDEMWIWNMNQESNMTRGLKNVKIEYSEDGEQWKELKPEEDIKFSESTVEGYPFQFAKASGNETISATNLNDGNNTPVRFGGEKAKYVKITAEPNAGVGSWGDTYFGLSELRFTQKIADKTELEKLYNEYKDMEQGNYTDESWGEFQKALDNVKAVIENKEVTQEEIDSAIKTLNLALDNLEEKEDSNNSDNSNNNNGNNNSDNNNSNEDDGKGDKLPSTGDASSSTIMLLLGAGAVVAGGVALKKRKREE